MSVSGWRIAERDAVQKAIAQAPLQVREKYEFWKERIEDEGPLGVRTWKGFRDHALKGGWSGHRSSYLNEKYRVIYRFDARWRMVFVEHLGPHDDERRAGMKQPTYQPTRRYANLMPADRVRIACELKGLTQAELARRAGLNTSHLSEMMHGKRAIGLAIAQRLSKVLGIPAARLLEIEEPAEEQRKEIERALARLRRHIKAARSIGEDTERILLKDIEEAIEANRATA